MLRIRAKDRLIGEKLASQGIPDYLKGKPLKIPQFNFTIPLENKVRSVLGPPHYASRARSIETITHRLLEDLTFEYARMTDEYREKPDLFASKWKELLHSLELDAVNDLIDRHNTYYPIEANLRIDPDSGAYLNGSIPLQAKEHITVDWLLEKFPPQHEHCPEA
ncbi:MAG: hypothetical protein SVM79_01200 [Chloroflexota bacterium]|nr:hypothetical protein [Chloroflexota bacterium]